MKGFLERWADGESEIAGPPGQVAGETDQSVPGPETLPTETGTCAMPLAEWKAKELNQLFEEHGVTRKRGRLTADTVRHGQSRNDPDGRAKLNSARVFPPACIPDDLKAASAIHETTALLATAYRRYAAIQELGADPRNDSGDGDLANSSASSVHGVVL